VQDTLTKLHKLAPSYRQLMPPRPERIKTYETLSTISHESAKVGQILFWLFPYEQSTFSRRKTRTNRVSRGSNNVRMYRGEREIDRVLAR